MPDSILDTIDIIRLGKELQAARKQARLTQEDAASIIGVARTTITAIENGERKIKEGELIKLSRAYKRQLNDFLRPRPALETVEVTQAQFRSSYLRTDADNEAIQPALYELQDLCRDYLDLEQLLESPLIRNYPAEYQLGVLPVDQAAENLALEERHRLRLGDGPLPIVRDVLEQAVGLRIFYIPLRPSSKFSAIYFYTDALGACVGVNRLQPEDRRRMSLAHEYGHFLTTRYKPEVLIQNGYQRIPESERFANLFAMHFLMPASGLIRRINEVSQARGKQTITVGIMCDIANQYGVSVEALVDRLEMLQVIPTGTGGTLKRGGMEVRKIQQELELGAIVGREDTVPLRYQSLAIQAFAEGLITEGQFAKFLRIDRVDARQIAEDLEEESPIALYGGSAESKIEDDRDVQTTRLIRGA